MIGGLHAALFPALLCVQTKPAPSELVRLKLELRRFDWASCHRRSRVSGRDLHSRAKWTVSARSKLAPTARSILPRSSPEAAPTPPPDRARHPPPASRSPDN